MPTSTYRALRAALPLCFLTAAPLSLGCHSKTASAPVAANETASTPATNATASPQAAGPTDSPIAHVGGQDADTGEKAPSVTTDIVGRLLSSLSSPALAVPLTPDSSTKLASQLTASPGLIVCYPVATSAAANDQTDFGAGCGFYLELHAAGRPELGQTPTISSAYRAAVEMKQPTLRLHTADEAVSLATKTGATHIALGEIAGDATSGTLTYQLYRVDPKGGTAAPVGDPLVVSGSRAQILAALPKMAATLRTRLIPSLATAALPPATKATPDEMVYLGAAAAGAHTMTAPQRATLASLWQRVPEAGVLYLGGGAGSQNNEAVAKKILSDFPDNSLACAHVGYVAASSLVPFAPALHAEAKRFPRSYALAHSEVWLSRVEGRLDQEQAAAARTLQDAPHNPDALLAYGYTLSTAAQAVRRGKMYDRMSANEAAYVEQVYPRWFASVRRAAEIDSDYGKAWFRVASAGTFAGERAEATAAYDHARTLLGPDRDLLSWGLQMFHPKWGGDPAKLREVAEDAAKQNWPNPWDAMSLASDINQAGLPDVAKRMAEDLVKRSDAVLAKAPKDRVAHYGRAIGMRQLGQAFEARKEFEQVALLFPDDAQIQFEVGEFLLEKGRLKGAEAAFANAIRLNPKHVKALANRGHVLKEMHRLPEAEQSLLKAISISPDYGQAWAKLGMVYMMEKKYDPGIAAYKKAMALQIIWPEVYVNLSYLYYMKKDWRSAIDIAEQGESLFPQDANMPGSSGAALLETHDWDKSIAANQRALALNDSFASSHVNLGEALIGKGNVAEGRKEVERGLQIGGPPEMIQEAKAVLAKHPG